MLGTGMVTEKPGHSWLGVLCRGEAEVSGPPWPWLPVPPSPPNPRKVPALWTAAMTVHTQHCPGGPGHTEACNSDMRQACTED